jgi:hypothetical protein
LDVIISGASGFMRVHILHHATKGRTFRLEAAPPDTA